MSADVTVPRPDDPRHLIERVQAEIMAEADRLRLRDPDLARREREVERAWAAVAPPGAAGSSEELLLDRVDRLAMIDVDAPLGAKPGVRQVKGAIRKGTYWYLRYLTDQLNALHGVQTRLLHRLDDRLRHLERASGIDDVLDDLLGPPPGPSATVGAAAAAVFDDGVGAVLVVSCGGGDAVGALAEAGIRGHGVDADADAVARGIDAGRDLRVAPPLTHLAELGDGALGGLVLAGFAERVMVADAVDLLATAGRVLAPDGVLVVAVADPAGRSGPEAELLGGRGLSTEAWALVGSGSGWTTEIRPCDDERVTRLLVARRAH